MSPADEELRAFITILSVYPTLQKQVLALVLSNLHM